MPTPMIEASRDRVAPLIRKFFTKVLADLKLQQKDSRLPSPFPAVMFCGRGSGRSTSAELFADMLGAWATLQNDYQKPLVISLPELLRHIDDTNIGIQTTHYRGRALGQTVWNYVKASVCVVLDDVDRPIKLRPDRQALWRPIFEKANRDERLKNLSVAEDLPDAETMRRSFLTQFAQVRGRRPTVVILDESPMVLNDQNYFCPVSAEWITKSSWLDTSGLPVWSDLLYA
jgi:hypothetical protein